MGTSDLSLDSYLIYSGTIPNSGSACWIRLWRISELEWRYVIYKYLKEILIDRKTSSSSIKDVLPVSNTLVNCTCTEQSVLLSSLILSGP
jgi:hypothetical protein